MNLAVSPNHLAYIIYTSGSTGKPKGVMVEHKQYVNAAYAWQDAFKLSEMEVNLLQIAGISFDVFAGDLAKALMNGGTLILFPEDLRLDFEGMYSLMKQHRASLFESTPSLIIPFMDYVYTHGLDIAFLKLLILGSDICNVEDFQKLMLRFGDKMRIINSYGVTEATIDTSFYEELRDKLPKSGTVPIGKPLPNMKFYILDEEKKLQPVGISGELCIGGSGVSRGYISQKELTSERFIENPYVKGEHIYKTGDLAKWLPDGNVEFLGRRDFQVKVRGYRIEPGEIESQLKGINEIKNAVVIDREDTSGDKYLCAYFIADREIEAQKLKESLSRSLPKYMIPTHFVQIKEIPLTSNGKVDRKALPSPEIRAKNKYIAPRDDLEEKLVEIWSKVLGKEKDIISIDANFFHLGGHSLKATILASKIHKTFEVKVPLATFFKYPYIEEIAKYIKGKAKDNYADIKPAKKKEYYPLSSAQKRLYFLQQMDTNNISYNIPFIFPLLEGMGKEKLEKILTELIGRHESLRTSFEMIDGKPVQKIHQQVPFKIEYYQTDESDLDKIRETLTRPFDLSKAPLMRAVFIIISSSPSQPVGFIDMHHIITDATSHTLLISEIKSLYAGKKLPDLRLQYKDFSEWQNSEEQQALIKQQESYWQKMYSDEIPALNLPADYPRPLVQSFDGSTVGFALRKKETQMLKDIAKETETSLFMVILSLYTLLFSKLSGQEDIIIGTTIAARRHADLQNIVGMFVNTLALRNYPRWDKSFTEFLQEVKIRTLGAFENQEYQFEDLIDKIAVPRDISRNPLFDAMFNWLNHTEYQENIFRGNEQVLHEHKKSVAKFDLTLSAIDADKRLYFSFEYSTKLFKTTTIEKFISYFKQIIHSITRDINQQLANLEILSDHEKHQLLYGLNPTEASYPKDKTIHELFERQVEKTPDKKAVVFEDKQLTYKELNEKANRLAGVLRKKGVRPEVIVGIMTEPSLEMIVGIMGILKAGGAYLPIDPNYPKERIQYMLEDSGAPILLTQQHLAVGSGLELSVSSKDRELILKTERVVGSGLESSVFMKTARRDKELILKTDNSRPDPIEVICPDSSELYNEEASNLEMVTTPESLAYIIYTSGTTGRPKGVMIEHRNVVRLLVNDKMQFDFNKKDVWTMFHSFCFDFSVWEMYGALLYGGRLVLVPRLMAKEPTEYLNLLKKEQITVLNQTPTAFYHLMKEELKSTEKQLRVRYVIFGGEALKPGKLKGWREKYPAVKLINMYGITETTVHVTYKEITEHEIESDISNIGGPIPTLTAYIMDKNMRLAPIGVMGELCVGGEGVGRGYLNMPELTAERFMPNPYKPEERLYKSGDLARWVTNGDLEYLGRIDHQVKIRGFRIELGEIEAQLLKKPEIKEAAVLAKEADDGQKFLCAYIVAEKEFTEKELKVKKLTMNELREHLSQSLPDYMVPSYFVQLEQMPQTANGKINRKALLVMGENLGTGVAYQPPRNEIEKSLVEIWEQVLGRKNIGINDNFFMIGGDSIKIIQILSRLNTLGYKLSVKDVFLSPTVMGIAPLVRRSDHIAEQGAITGILPLTPIQKRFFTTFISTERHHFNHAVMLYSKDRFDPEGIKSIFAKIQEHHDALRMVFKEENGHIIQINQGLDFPLSLEEFDLINNENPRQELEFQGNKIQSSIDLEHGPLMKLGLFHLNDGDRLLIVSHHLVVDGLSWRILSEDLGIMYTQYQKREPLQLPLKTDSYKMWSEKITEYANSGRLLAQKEYWKKLEEEQIPQIPSDFQITTNFAKDSNRISFSLSEQETNLLLGKANVPFNTEINDILLTTLGLSLIKMFGHSKVLISLEGHGREEIIKDIDVSRTIGWFTSIFPVILNMSYCEDLARQIIEIKETLRRLPDKGVGYGILKYLTFKEYKKDLKFNLHPQISFNYLGQFDSDLKGKFFEIAKEPAGNPQSPNAERDYILDISGAVASNRLIINVVYNTHHYKQESIEQLINHYKIELGIIITFCSAKEGRVYTPSDFTYKKLSIEKVRCLQELYAIKDLYPLTPLQEGMLFHALYDSSSTAYFEQISYRLKGKLEVSLVEKAIQKLSQRHDILRTVFLYENMDRPIQVVLKEIVPEVIFEDIKTIDTEEEKEAYIRNFKDRDKKRSFDLSKDTLMRVSILQLSDIDYEVIWSHHHILMDGWCLGILMTEFSQIYHSLAENNSPTLPQVTPYSRYIDWLESQDKEQSRKYWSKYLSSYDEIASIPKSKEKKISAGSYRNERYISNISVEKTRKLSQISGKMGVTLNTIIQTVWGILLSKYNNKKDVVFGAVVSGRPSQIAGIESIVGLFINTIPVRIQYDKNTQFDALLEQVQKEALKSESHHYYPLAEIQAASELKQKLIDHIIIFENYPIGEQIEKLPLNISQVEVFEQTNYALNLIVSPADKLSIKFGYNANVYDGKFVQTLAGHFLRIIDQIMEDEKANINELELITEEEKNQVLYEFNSTETYYPKDKTIHELFEEQVKKTPEAVALVFKDQKLTYRELNNRANQLAHYLLSLGIGPDVPVGIYGEGSIEMVVGLIGILKAGGAYVPLDPGYPRERVAFMLKDSKVPVLLTQRNLVRKLPEHELRVICLDMDWKKISKLSDQNLIDRVKGKNLAYTIFTSGSTGKPKGVQIPHQALTNFLYSMSKQPGLTEKDVLLAVTTICFDIAALELYLPLIVGAQVVLAGREVASDGTQLLEVLTKSGATVMQATPATWKMLLEAGWEDNDHIKILCGGEAMSKDLANRLLKKGSSVWNVYGPTETTIWSTLYQVSSVKDIDNLNAPETIGRPINNTQIYILDSHLQPMPIGVPGELYIGGDGLALGYLNRPKLNKKKFILNPFSKKTGARLFSSGDSARYLPDGNIEFLGRLDYQVKIRGFRIEPGEIENELLKKPEIKEAVVLAKEADDGQKFLCAYIIAEKEFTEKELAEKELKGKKLTVNELREHLSKSLPDYMIPSYFVQLEQMPQTANGKINRQALLEMGENLSTGVAYHPPRNVLEKRLVEIWEQVLGKNHIGIDDNFFMSGGHSLKVINVNSLIHKELKVSLPLKEFFTNPTIRRLARYILFHKPGISNEKGIEIPLAELEKEPYLLLNKSTPKKVFCFPPITGFGTIFSSMAVFIDNYSIYAFNYLEDEENLIKKYTNYILDIQPEGPYRLLGYSAGGNIAFEIAKEFEKMGHVVSDIIFLDSFKKKGTRKPTKKSLKNIEEEITNIISDQGIAFEPYRQRLVERAKKFQVYLSGIDNSGLLNANLHLIATQEGKRYNGGWKNSTNNQYKVYQCHGKHWDILNPGFRENNIELIHSLLNNIFKQDHSLGDSLPRN